MKTNVIQTFGDVHDNQIMGYHVDMVNHVLKMETVFENKEKIDIVFTDWLTHHFEDLIDYNIIYDIQQITIDHYIESNRELLEKSRRYGFQAQRIRGDEKDFVGVKQYLTNEKYNIYSISSSIGLNGIVIAKDISINIRAII